MVEMGNLLICVISCGNWNNAADAGVWNLNLNNYRVNTNNTVSFRLGLQFHLKS